MSRLFWCAFVVLGLVSFPAGVYAGTKGDALFRGVQAREKGDHAKALKLFAEARRRGNDSHVPSFEEAVTYYWKGDSERALLRIDESRALAKSASAAQRAAVLQLRGRILLAAGKREQAIASLREAILLSPRDATSHAAMGTVLRAGFKLTLARRSYDKALLLDPDIDEAREGLDAIEKLNTWNLSAQLFTLVSEGDRDSTVQSPGGEVSIEYRLSPEHELFARGAHRLPAFGDPGAQKSSSGALTRGEVGGRLQILGRVKLSLSYMHTRSPEPAHHAVVVEMAVPLKNTVFLASVRPGVNHAEEFDLLGQLGGQQILHKSVWIMLQWFEYQRWGQDGTDVGSTTFVGTAAWQSDFGLDLRTGAGVGWYEPGRGYPIFFTGKWQVHDDVKLGATYEYFGGFTRRHQIGATVGVGF